MDTDFQSKSSSPVIIDLKAQDLSKSNRKPPDPKRSWWKEASVYQIYPASFYDSDGDGFGDIRGIIGKLDYLKNLGVDVVWLCPVYESPQNDMGYDISNYREVHKPYGTVQDLEDLIEGLHHREIKIIMDLVVNHTSDKESRKSKTNSFRDWYIWRPPRIDSCGRRHPPNNWASIFGGSAWAYDVTTDEYYLHLFHNSQPDLNWENEDCVSAVHDILKFWLNKHVDGFRMDVINLISKTVGLPDAPVTLLDSAHQPAWMHYAHGPRLHEHLRGLRSILDKYNAFAVGEMPWVKEPEHVLKAVQGSRNELNMIFQFDIVDIDIGPTGKFTKLPWSLCDLRAIVEKWQKLMTQNDGWNALFLENHDQPRSVSRFASDKPEFRVYSAKMLATFLSFQAGTLYLFQGQDIGMVNVPKDWSLDEFKDVETKNFVEDFMGSTSASQSLLFAETMDQVRAKARDNSRTPFQWDSSANAGFTSGSPWMRVNDDYKVCNAKSQLEDPNSVFSYWQKILRLRRKLKNIFVYGDFELVDRSDNHIFAYQRSSTDGRAIVLCNFAACATSWEMPSEVGDICELDRIVLHNYSITSMPRIIHTHGKRVVEFLPFEAMVFVELHGGSNR
ncbi:hypothetical protein TWF694_003631 [Orbilia ellipsospora]|uniref:Glycosyl hydrolase family 13 catalytic domain-containing protein n=1 Tax=Orbilia ellipsospora TaxID=2528407 RepID=A0AAV9WZX9_9PEZI